MALTRKFLEAMGLEDAKISAIIEEHDKTVTGLKEVRDQYKAEAEKNAEAQKKLSEMQANPGEDWESKYNTLLQTFNEFKAETANREKAEKVKAAYTQLLRDANVDPKRIDAILKITDLGDKKLNADGRFDDAEQLTESIKNEWAAFIQASGTKGTDVETPPQTRNSSTLTRADLYAKDEHGRYKMSTAERQKALVENPDIMRT